MSSFPTKAAPSISLVIPILDEQEALGIFLERVSQVFAGLEEQGLGMLGEILFIDDGSTDNSVQKLVDLQRHDPRIRILELSRNFGKEAALTAGLQESRGDVVVPIDVDLQDPPDLIPEMLARWREGFDVVLARRCDRGSDTLLKRVTASWFYRIHNRLSEPNIPENVGDFRLMDRQVVEALKLLPETRRFMKGLFAWVGFRTCLVDYSRPPRAAGDSKFHTWKLWNLALEGLTSFGTAPLRVWSYLGATIAILSFLRALFIAGKVLVYGIELPGYASIFVAVCFFGGLQLLGIGVLGEYLGRTYLESKGRPVYLVRRRLDPPSSQITR